MVFLLHTLEAYADVVNLGVLHGARVEIMLVPFLCILAWTSGPDVGGNPNLA